MQIEINFNEIDLNDWIEFDGEDANAPKLKDVFKDEILHKFIEKLNADVEVRKYVRTNIDNGLAGKIAGYKDDVAIKAIVEQIIIQRLRDSGSFIFLDSYRVKVEDAVRKYLADYERKVDTAISKSVRLVMEEIIDSLYKTSAIREFLDTEKLARYIEETIKAKCEVIDNG